MNRNHPPSPQDIINEQLIADEVHRHTGLIILHKPGEYAFCDRRGFVKDNGSLIHTHNIEIKARTFAWGKYPTFMLSASKLAQLMKAYSCNRTIPMVVVRPADQRVRYCIVSPEILHKISNGWGGRKDRGDPADLEWCVYIPIELFKYIEDYKTK